MYFFKFTHILQANSFESMKLWAPFIKELDPEVRLLLCDVCKPGDGKKCDLAYFGCDCWHVFVILFSINVTLS